MDPSEVQGATTSVVCPDDPLSSMHGEGTADDPRSTLGERHTGRSDPRAKLPSDFELLYHTLVADSAVPSGFMAEFITLEEPVRRAAKRAHIRAVSMTDAEATMELESHQRKKNSEERAGVLLAGQLVMLAELKPRKFRTRMQRLAYEGPTARRDAEADVRSKYLRILANILKNTETPMEQLLREDRKN